MRSDEKIEEGDGSPVALRRKRWIDTVKECFKKRGLDVRHARRMEHDRIA